MQEVAEPGGGDGEGRARAGGVRAGGVGEAGEGGVVAEAVTEGVAFGGRGRRARLRGRSLRRRR